LRASSRARSNFSSNSAIRFDAPRGATTIERDTVTKTNITDREASLLARVREWRLANPKGTIDEAIRELRKTLTEDDIDFLADNFIDDLAGAMTDDQATQELDTYLYKAAAAFRDFVKEKGDDALEDVSLAEIVEIIRELIAEPGWIEKMNRLSKARKLS
jgi:hypothetical protein